MYTCTIYIIWPFYIEQPWCIKYSMINANVSFYCDRLRGKIIIRIYNCSAHPNENSWFLTCTGYPWWTKFSLTAVVLLEEKAGSNSKTSAFWLDGYFSFFLFVFLLLHIIFYFVLVTLCFAILINTFFNRDCAWDMIQV